MIKAGAARIDITPDYPVWMDGMIRAHPSTGVHDPVFAKALVFGEDDNPARYFIIISLDVCLMAAEECAAMRAQIEKQWGVPASQVIIAAIHNHSGPATVAKYAPPADLPLRDKYLEQLRGWVQKAVAKAWKDRRPARAGYASGHEDTISHYRRLLADDGQVVMNWEEFPPERLVGPLGEIDPEVGVLRFVDLADEQRNLAVLFNYACHPNVLSGDNYLITAEYPGRAEQLLERELGGQAVFVNGAQGTMDIDGLRDRDWEGLERIGQALAGAVRSALPDAVAQDALPLCGATAFYTVPARKVSDQEFEWAQGILKVSQGIVKPLADGVGDDYKAKLLDSLRKVQDQPVPLEQVGIALGDCAIVSFPGELFTEIGREIKAHSPFKHTWLIGLANGSIGYVPTRRAIKEGGYAVSVRRVDDAAEDIVIKQSLALLNRMYAMAGANK
ncbi:MAG: neutral/alkaline non-lysosomal ceramidase N-terminal domain-containing protein [Lentisphaerae bacterium]|nr:neutral/alkaline non-lysosomal ceramidase N-terminal domain-containing protein [Lentisphaerota bacterium]